MSNMTSYLESLSGVGEDDIVVREMKSSFPIAKSPKDLEKKRSR